MRRENQTVAATAATAAIGRIGPIAIGIAALTLAVFVRTVAFEFVNYDDNDYVTKNPAVLGGLSGEGLVWAFTKAHSANWHPLTWLSHMLDVELYGRWAGGHHLTNVLLHAAAAAVLFLALARLTRATWPSAFAAALFAVHPLRVESVAWVSERKDVLSGLFFALTLLAYAAYVERPSARRYALVALALACGLASKPMLVTLPVVLLLLDLWPLRRFGESAGTDGARRARPIVEKLPLFALSGLSAAVTVLVQDRALSGLDAVPFGSRLANAALATATYLRQLVFPADLSVFYPLRSDLPPGVVATAVAVLAVLTLGAFLLRRRAPYAWTGWLWYLVMLLPVSGLVQVGSQARADRYTYLPQIGVALAIGFGLAELARRRTLRAPIVGGAALALAACAVLSVRQAGHWRNPITLWSHAVEVTPDGALAHHLLAGGFLADGRYDEAAAHYAIAARLRPDHVNVRNGLASTLKRLGRYEEALVHYRAAWQLEPDSVIALNNYGWFLATCPQDELRDGALAVRLGERAAELSANPAILDTLSAAYAEAGDFAAAVACAERALQATPPEASDGLRARLAGYREQRPFRDHPPTPGS